MAMTSHTRRANAQPSYRMLLARGTLVAACAVLAAACGSTAAPSSNSGTTTSAAKIALDVSFTGSPTIAAKHWTLRCDPAGGTFPDAAAACGKLLKLKDGLFAPLPTRVMCPMIMASADRATVSGSWYGKKVHETIIDGGCDLGRWSQLNHIFN